MAATEECRATIDMEHAESEIIGSESVGRLSLYYFLVADTCAFRRRHCRVRLDNCR
jgi:hypothetical protein